MTDFTIEPTVWIALPDGTRLAAQIWRPAGHGQFPAVLEFLPYRRRDGTAPRDDSTYPAYARAGILGIRVDSRGNGDSEGVFDDEYSPQELADIYDVIAWIAAQPWSNGSVGMMGISWGGFNGLQVAAMQPPALKAVISIASTADRYTDDIHYKGGCLLSANVSWAGTMLSYASRPPDPEVVGNRWAEIWRDRLDAEPMLLETWLRHQRRDAYWQHGSIREDWDAIQCPVWVIAGWSDGYRNCPSTLAHNLAAPVKATVGPWVHKYPHFAYPHPRIDYLGHSIDWWHQWLSGAARGIEDWPDYQAYMIESARPQPWTERYDGRWVGTEWPREEAPVALTLGADGRLGSEAAGPITIATPQHCGTAAGEYFTLAPNADLPADQRMDDALSVWWQSEPLDAPMDLLGRAVLTSQVAIDKPQGNLVARLVDVHPDGTSALIARGVLNLCHRNSHAEPEPMAPGVAVPVRLELDEMGYRVRAGHRLRLALSTAYWPLILPSPEAVVAEIAAGPDAHIALPVVTGLAEIDLPEPQDPAPLAAHPEREAGHMTRKVEQDLTHGRVRYTLDDDSGLIENPHHGMQWRETRKEVWEIDPADPEGAWGQLDFTTLRQRGGWHTRTRSEIHISCQPDHYQVAASVTAWHGAEELHRKTWSFSVPRDHM
ncbi:MAG: CocE/NonD family hydrolase [Pseudomonadota bacterium]